MASPVLINGFHLVCPLCRGELLPVSPQSYRCTLGGEVFDYQHGIWRFITAERLQYYSVFMREYGLVRRAEGRAGQEAAFYRGLPYTVAWHEMAGAWKIRAASYRSFIKNVLVPLESVADRPLICLDSGSGNGWLSNRLAERGHQAAALDLGTSDWDGLGAYRHYSTTFLSLQAEFDRLPLSGGQCDLVIYNSSFHYSADFRITLAEAWRVLKPEGRVIVLDTPVYRSGESGRKMVHEREQHFIELVGVPSNSLPAENFLTHSRLRELAEELGMRWRLLRPYYGLRWLARPWWRRMMGRREPAGFFLLVGEKILSG